MRSLDLFQDVRGLCSPDERFGLFVMAVHVLVDGHDQLLHIAKDATAEAVLGEVTKEFRFGPESKPPTSCPLPDTITRVFQRK